MGIYADKITEQITIPMVLKQYGIETSRHHRIPCPLHHGDDPNFCYTDNVFHCWTCGEKGNVITFVMKFFGLGFNQAIAKLDSDFGLNITRKRISLRERQIMAYEKRIDKSKRDFDESVQENYRRLASAHAAMFRYYIAHPDPELKEYLNRIGNALDDFGGMEAREWQMI